VSPPFARKRFAQHFLTQPGIAERIVALAGLRTDSVVLEIGPGRGALTRLLAARCKRLVAVEVDRDLSDALRRDFAAQPSVEVVSGDVLDVDLPSLVGAGPATVVANLPYNISTPVLMRLLEQPEHFDRLVLMLQREVAERIGAPPGTKTYGALSVVVQTVADVRIALHVPSAAFAPRPKVDSAVVLIEPRRPVPLSAAERRQLRHVVRSAFSRRRKQLANVIAPLAEDPRAVLTELGLDPRQRPETLTPADFVRLAAAVNPSFTRRHGDTEKN
jgi:16S rRNA (adenine1518-N6/adenine1519-N6)-dimethyltransferase